MNAWLDVPRNWLDSLGEIARFGARLAGQVYSGRVLRFFGEALRQAGILILGSALVIWGLVFVLGLQCGIEGAYLLRAQGAPAYAGVFSAWCDLREIMPYAFGYMLAAKVGTGIVADPALGGQGFFDYTVLPAVVGQYSMSTQLYTQVWAVGVTLLWSGIISFILFWVIDKIFGLRSSREVEVEGLDINEHGERAYNY